MTTTPVKKDKTAGRVLLPDYVVPVQYDLKVTPDLKAFVFDGLLVLEMTTGADIPTEMSNSITLHAKELLFRKASYQVGTKDGGAEVIVAQEVRLQFGIGRFLHS
jgi:hypothetical protein